MEKGIIFLSEFTNLIEPKLHELLLGGPLQNVHLRLLVRVRIQDCCHYMTLFIIGSYGIYEEKASTP